MYNRIRIKVRNLTNPLFAPLRRRIDKIPCEFTIISNNCWGGLVYMHYGLPYLSPTVGLYFFSPEYLKFVRNLKYYMSLDLKFISYKESKYKEIIESKNQTHVPIGLLDDLEIMFLHYPTAEDAKDKWNRRKKRINWGCLYVKMSEMNLSTPELLKEFDNLPFDNKLIFTTKDYNLNSQVIFKDYVGENEVKDDTTYFNKYINLRRWLNHRT